MTPCDKWLETLSDAQLDNYSQCSLANEAWKRGAGYAAQKILDQIEMIDTPHVAVSGCAKEATAISAARVEADKFINRVTYLNRKTKGRN